MRNPHLRYDGGSRLRIPKDPNTIIFWISNIVQKGLVYHTLLSVHYYIPSSRSFNDGLRLIWNYSTTIFMSNIWYKNKVIDLYIEYDVDIPNFAKKPLFL